MLARTTKRPAPRALGAAQALTSCLLLFGMSACERTALPARASGAPPRAPSATASATPIVAAPPSDSDVTRAKNWRIVDDGIVARDGWVAERPELSALLTGDTACHVAEGWFLIAGRLEHRRTALFVAPPTEKVERFKTTLTNLGHPPKESPKASFVLEKDFAAVSTPDGTISVGIFFEPAEAQQRMGAFLQAFPDADGLLKLSDALRMTPVSVEHRVPRNGSELLMLFYPEGKSDLASARAKLELAGFREGADGWSREGSWTTWVRVRRDQVVATASRNGKPRPDAPRCPSGS